MTEFADKKAPRDPSFNKAGKVSLLLNIFDWVFNGGVGMMRMSDDETMKQSEKKKFYNILFLAQNMIEKKKKQERS